MVRGRKRKPTPLHIADGTFRPDRHAGDHPEPEAETPDCPPFLQGTARREWMRIVPELEKLDLLSKIDQATLGVYCQARADYSWAVYKLRRDGRLIKTAAGGLKTHPAVSIQKAAANTIRQFAAEFGLSPSARGRINISPPEASEDPEDDEMFSA